METKEKRTTSITLTNTPKSNPTTTPKTKSKARAREKRPCKLSYTKNPFILLSLTLAALSKPQNPSSKPLLKLCSNKFLQSLVSESESESQPLLLNPIISLLPLLLRSQYDEIACKIIGAVALLSFEANEKVASDDEIVTGLVLKVVRSDKWEIRKAVCNALLDVCTTSFARHRLLHLSGLNFLMLGFIQVQRPLKSLISLNATEKNGGPCLVVERGEDELPMLLLDTIVTLTNFCNNEQLKRIPRPLVGTLLTYLKEVWSKVRDQMFASKLLNFSEGRCCYVSCLTPYNLAETIFRLSLDASGIADPISSEIIIRRILGPSQSSFKNFMSEHWELSPFVIRELQKDFDLPHDIFSSFTHLLTCKGTVSRFLSSALQGMVACPPVALNEIDTLSFLSDVRNNLGSPVTYQQDIRVVRTNLHSKSEEHYSQLCLSSGTEALRSFSIDDILKIEGAYGEGYTIALRGMEFRVKSIADIARGMASLFGQPSVGANLYVTPPNSQGLACHFDDHCVFVCQLCGTKQWTVFLQPIVKLPRLYEQCEVPEDLTVESRQILLREGDILYIPRGFAHKACTVTGVGESDAASEFSVHVTLAIEVETPFEWVGFAHVALHRWSHEMDPQNISPGFPPKLLAFSVSILHVAIRLISGSEPVYRKACLVAASSLPSETKNWLDENQRAIFTQLINKVNELASFTDSLEFVQLAIQRNEDPFHWLRWLGHLNGGKLFAQDIWSLTSDQVCEILPFICQKKDNAEAAFAHVKSKFCGEVVFDDAKESFKSLYALYKKARMQYMNGMLSLHC